MKLMKDILYVWWVCLKSVFQLSYGVYKLNRLKQPIVAVFGGKGAYEEGKYSHWAEDFSKKIVHYNMSIITGGGPGIMEAASCGAYEGAHKQKGFSLGIGVKGVDVNFLSDCAPVIMVDSFFVRKWLLIHYASAFIFFPGGIGTVDELFEVLNLTKLGKIKKRPLILVGSNYWKDLIDWYEHGMEYHLIEMPLSSSVMITDDVDEAVRVIQSSY
jgi:hypothetical protein